MTLPASSTPRYDAADGVARITLARPAHRNRLENADLATLMELFARIDADPSIRCVVLQADVLPERPVFSAGYNTGDFDAGPAPVSFEQVVEALERLRPVTLCALNGSVYGGATDFVLACDLAVGATGIEMRMPAAALGIHYYASGLVRYVSRLGVSAAKRAFLTARPLDAETLLHIGYLQELVPAQALAAHVSALAAHIATLAPQAVQDLKRSLNELARGDFDLERLRQRELASMASADFAEGRRAFAERRAPRFEGR